MASHVRSWEDGATRWVLLAGKATITRGDDVLRADRFVVRIDKKAWGHRLDIYTEPATDPKKGHQTIDMTGPLRIAGDRSTELDDEDRALLARAFPRSFSAAPRTSPAAFVQRPALRDEQVQRSSAPQDPGRAFPDLPVIDPFQEDAPGRAAPIAPVLGPDQMPIVIDDPPQIDPLPGPPLTNPPIVVPESPDPLTAPLLPNSMRVVNVFLRKNAPNSRFEKRERTQDGTDIFVITGGVLIVAESFGKFGTIDVSADNAIIWTKLGGPGSAGTREGVQLVQDPEQPLEMYLEGNVVLRQDERKLAGTGDQALFEARRLYMDLRSQRVTVIDGEFSKWMPDFVSPFRTRGQRIQQFKDVLRDADGRTTFGPALIQVDQTMSTGSRFPYPGYKFNSRSLDLTELAPKVARDKGTGSQVADKDDPDAPREQRYLVDGRQNVFYMGPIPIFYWPRFLTTTDDINLPLQRLTFRANNVFGQQALSDWDAFKLLGIRRPLNVDQWNLDLDYLSYRGVAFGSEFGYFGRDLSKDLFGTDLFPGIRESYNGYFDFWGLRDHGIDNLGPGPAILNNTPPSTKTYFRNAVPPLQDFRGRVIARHMQSLNAVDASPFDDTRLQLEFAYLSDRNFLEEYYKRLFDTGQDQSTLLYFIRQHDSSTLTLLAQPNLQNFYTEAQSLPRLDYYRLGDAPFWGLFTYNQHSGINYTNVHTSIEVNNPNVFAFLPFDPVTNTSGPFTTLRAFTAHELDLPISLGFMRVTPFVQGQLTGWTNQLDYQSTGRAWGAAGARANFFAWKAYPWVESELLNVHGVAHKMTFDMEYRTAYSNVPLSRIGVTDNLDDNTYEYVRRYYAMTQFVGALLPIQYDPRYLALRRTVSPITGSVDIQDSIETLRLDFRQRLQTKRGPEGNRRVVDYVTFDIGTTYFPNSKRDNFGTPFGQTTYNLEWYLGDRTNFISTGWFEQFDISGRPLLIPANKSLGQGINVINAGFLFNRPPRGSVYFGYYIIDSGTINTSALNAAYTYWLSPKWFGSVSMSYDFGNQVMLGTVASITRVGADFLTTIGLSVDPQRQSYMFQFEVVPRLSPNMRLGSTAGMARFDSRFAAYD